MVERQDGEASREDGLRGRNEEGGEIGRGIVVRNRGEGC